MEAVCGQRIPKSNYARKDTFIEDHTSMKYQTAQLYYELVLTLMEYISC